MTRVRSRSQILLVVGFSIVAWVGPAPRAQAMSHNVRYVLASSIAGMLIGTALGAATLPLTKDARVMFMGSAAGLWLGGALSTANLLLEDDAPYAASGSPSARAADPVLLARLSVTPEESKRRVIAAAWPVWRF